MSHDLPSTITRHSPIIYPHHIHILEETVGRSIAFGIVHYIIYFVFVLLDCMVFTAISYVPQALILVP